MSKKEENPALGFAVLLFVAWASLSLFSGSSDGDVQQPACHPPESASLEHQALAALYTHAGGENWKPRDNWCNFDVPWSEWEGISASTSVPGGMDIRLAGVGLRGDSVLSDDRIWRPNGVPISVGTLDLSSNMLNESINYNIRWPRGLTNLQLGRNELTGDIETFLRSLPGSLEALGIENNKLAGGFLPGCSGLCFLSRLTKADLSNLDFQNSALPSCIGTLQFLEFMYMQESHISGEIPETISELQSLRGLYLEHNDLVGPLPEGLFELDPEAVVFLHENTGLQVDPRDSIWACKEGPSPTVWVSTQTGGVTEVCQKESIPALLLRLAPGASKGMVLSVVVLCLLENWVGQHPRPLALGQG